MIGNIITDSEGNPLDNAGNKLAKSSYQPPKAVMDLFAKVQTDYQTAYSLQHRGFREFDGYSLLDRTRLDQELWGAYVGCEYVPAQKKWRWKGRKNTARNKLMSILARALAGILYPVVHAKNEENEEDKMAARVMRILIEDHLKKAKYEFKFLLMILTALVNPAIFVEVEYVEKMQTIKQRLTSGEWKVTQAVDEVLSGLALNSIPIDEVLLPDFYSGLGQIQNLPSLIRVRRIPYDLARGMYAGKYFDANGNDLFDFVQAGQTRIVMTGNEGQTLYDIEWTEADRNYVQIIVAKYRPEDLETLWVGGVFLGEQEDPMNRNPFTHRRLILSQDKWLSIPVYNIAMSGFEPIDPTGRFAYYKSGAFKEYWDDQTQNRMHQLLIDGTSLDVMKPVFISGIKKADSNVMAPGAVVGIPTASDVKSFGLGPNLAAAYQALNKQEADMSDSTKADPVPTIPTPQVSATQTQAAVQQARVFFGSFAIMIAQLIDDVGLLAIDCTIQNVTVGEIDTSVPEAISAKYKTYLVKGKDNGKSVTNKVVFTDKHVGRKYTKEQKENMEWDLYHKTGGEGSDQRIYETNPYQFARMTYSLTIDANEIVSKSTGTERQEDALAFNMLTDPRVLPFIDPQAVANDFVIDKYGGVDPDKYKRKGPPPNPMDPNGTGAPPGQESGMVVPQQNKTPSLV